MLYQEDEMDLEDTKICKRHKRYRTMGELLKRERDLTALIKRERGCLADPNYLTLVQKNNVTPEMRRITLDWMFELVDTTARQDLDPGSELHLNPGALHVFPGACSIFDRYLSQQEVCPSDLQDVALSALMCASKMLTDKPFTISAMENYYRINKLKMLEEQFVNTLHLEERRLVLPTDYFTSYTNSLTEQYTPDVIGDVVYHAYSLLPVFYLEYESVLHPPSVVAGACILESVSRLLGQIECLQILEDMVLQTGLHPSYFIKATRDVRRWVTKLLDAGN